MPDILVISDPHYLDDKLRAKEPARKNRFRSVDEMNHFMISEHNRIVTDPNSIVYFLGDIAFGKADACRAIINSLNGKKILIIGNHDRGNQAMMDMGFYAVFEQVVVNIEGVKVLLRHRPWYDEDNQKCNIFEGLGIRGVFHGHIHSGAPESLIAAGENPDVPFWNVNVCVEKTKFRPILIQEAIGRGRNQVKAAGWLGKSYWTDF